MATLGSGVRVQRVGCSPRPGRGRGSRHRQWRRVEACERIKVKVSDRDLLPEGVYGLIAHSLDGLLEQRLLEACPLNFFQKVFAVALGAGDLLIKAEKPRRKRNQNFSRVAVHRFGSVASVLGHDFHLSFLRTRETVDWLTRNSIAIAPCRIPCWARRRMLAFSFSVSAGWSMQQTCFTATPRTARRNNQQG